MNRSAQDQRVKTALDETRLLILGAQILFGFHLNGAFQSGFSELSGFSRGLHAASFLTMAIAIALLITPSLQHQLIDGGRATTRILGATTAFAAAALLPIAFSLGADLYIVIGHRFGTRTGAAVGIGFALLAIAGWYGAEWLVRRPPPQKKPLDEPDTPIDVRVEHMLTEARVMLPGAQALLGFQLAVILTDAFAALPSASKIVHVVALCCVSLAVILLIAPASFHRISFHGQNTEPFYRLGSTLVLVAAVPLAVGIVSDLYVAVTKALDRPALGAGIAFAGFLAIGALWFVHPLLRARRRG
jgi:Family of unknown function (DUF6328)